MNTAIRLSLLIIFAAQFDQHEAFFDWIELVDRLFFRPLNASYPEVFLVNESAQSKFYDDEKYKEEKPESLRKQSNDLTRDIDKWKYRHDTSNFALRFLIRIIVNSLEKKKAVLEKQRFNAKEARDLEPLCHERFHEYKPDVYEECVNAFQHKFLKQKGWVLLQPGELQCTHISVRKIEDPDGEKNIIAAYRHARRCSAVIELTPKDKIYISVYLIAGRNFTEKKRFAYFVLLNRDLRLGEVSKKRYWHISGEKKTEVAAYIES